MIKYTCLNCPDPCVLIVPDIITMHPQHCPYNEWELDEEDWKR